MIELIKLAIENPELPMDVVMLISIAFFLFTFKKVADKHYTKDEEFQRKQIRLLERILDKI